MNKCRDRFQKLINKEVITIQILNRCKLLNMEAKVLKFRSRSRYQIRMSLVIATDREKPHRLRKLT